MDGAPLPILQPQNASLGAQRAPLSAEMLEIRRVAQEFEAMVLGELLKPVFSQLDTDGLTGGGAGEEMFRPLLVEEYAKSMAQAGGVGLADSVVREMTRLQAAQVAPEEAADGVDR